MKAVIFSLIMIAGSFALANNPGQGGTEPGTPSAVKAKSMTCSELQGAVLEAGSLVVKGFGAVRVHASASACDAVNETAERSYWKTSDKSWFRPCFAGYKCDQLISGR